MSRAVEVLWGGICAIRVRLMAIAGQSERTLLVGTVLVASAVSAAMAFVLAQYYAVDVFSSLVFVPDDCWMDWGTQVGRHCFGDYGWSLGVGMRPNPWEPYPMLLPWNDYQPDRNDYLAAGMVPQLLFGFPAHWLGVPRLGLIGYLLALLIAVLSPAVWAARGARGLERVVVFVALGAAALPAWAVIDRGNSVGFIAPVGLVFLVALCRQRWALVAVTVVLATLIKPQFAVLAVALFAARQWRLGGLGVVGMVISNLATYLLWPRDFPNTIVQSIHNALHHGSPNLRVAVNNSSFGKGVLFIPDTIAMRKSGNFVPGGYLDGPRSVIGYVVLVVVVVCVLALGRRIPPVMVGIALLATASLFPDLAYRYYLIFVLPVAALVARDPDGPPGSGIFDRLGILGDRRRTVGICVTVAAALSIAQIALPGALGHAWILAAGRQGMTEIVGTTPVAPSTASLVPLLWLITCVAIIFSYARKPAPLQAAVTGAAAPMADDRPRGTSCAGVPIQ